MSTRPETTVNLPKKTSEGKRVRVSRTRPKRVPSGHEILVEKKVATKGSLLGLLTELKSLSERGGAALGAAYAAAASTFLQEKERLEDLNAERRFRQHARPDFPPTRKVSA